MIRESLAKGRFDDRIMAEARSVSNLKKTLRQTFEDAKSDEVTLKKLAYGNVSYSNPALVQYFPPGWLTVDKGKEENNWSDRKHLPKGKLSGLQFRADQNWVCQVRARCKLI